jgi:hypothetical protein
MLNWELLTIALDTRRGSPLFVQLSEALANDIRTGRLKPGDALPGTRALATRLRVNRSPWSTRHWGGQGVGGGRGGGVPGTTLAGTTLATRWWFARRMADCPGRKGRDTVGDRAGLEGGQTRRRTRYLGARATGRPATEIVRASSPVEAVERALALALRASSSARPGAPR